MENLAALVKGRGWLLLGALGWGVGTVVGTFVDHQKKNEDQQVDVGSREWYFINTMLSRQQKEHLAYIHDATRECCGDSYRQLATALNAILAMMVQLERRFEPDIPRPSVAIGYYAYRSCRDGVAALTHISETYPVHVAHLRERFPAQHSHLFAQINKSMEVVYEMHAFSHNVIADADMCMMDLALACPTMETSFLNHLCTRAPQPNTHANQKR